MTRKVLGIFLLLLALLALWAFLPGRDPATGAEDARETGAPPVPAAAGRLPAAAEALPADPLRESVVATAAAVEEAQVRVRFHDLLSGDLLTPRAAVLLEHEGKVRELRLDADGSLLIPFAGPNVLATAFSSHVPMLAVVRPEAEAGDIHLQVYPSARLTIEFEGCDATVLPVDASIRLELHSSRSERSRSDHGQSVLHGYSARMVESTGLPDLTRSPPQWFSAEQAAIWRSFMTEIRVTNPSKGPPVHAVMLLDFEEERTVTGQPSTWELMPAGCDLSWRTELPLQQLEPEGSLGGIVLNTQEGERWGMFQAGRGDSRLRLGWAVGGSITGRVPQEGLDSELMPPIVRLAAIVRGQEHSPINGQFANHREGTLDAVDGSFRFDDLPPGEYQLDAGWAVESQIYVSSTRIWLKAGQSLDQGVCPVRSGAPVHLELQLRDVYGTLLQTGDVFLPDRATRREISVHGSGQDAMDPACDLLLTLPCEALLQLHGLGPGHIFINEATRNPAREDLRDGVEFVRTVNSTLGRITFPKEDRVTLHEEFLLGTVSTALRFEYPADALDRSHTLYLTHSASGIKIPTHSLHDVLRPRKQVVEGVLHLAPGQYEALVLSNTASIAEQAEIHYYAFETISVEAEGRAITIKLQPGLSALGPEDAPQLRTAGDFAQFMVRSISGVVLKNPAVMSGKIGADGRIRLHGVPRGAVLQQNRDPISWTVNELGLLVPVR